MTGISRDDWLKALAEAGECDVDDREAITCTELMDMMGVDRQKARRRLEKMVAAGKAIRTTKRERAGHRMIYTVAYKLVP